MLPDGNLEYDYCAGDAEYPVEGCNDEVL